MRNVRSKNRNEPKKKGGNMVKRTKLLTIFLILLCASIIPITFISGCMADNNTMNIKAANIPTTNAAVNGMYPQQFPF
jgi:hypothetical protein